MTKKQFSFFATKNDLLGVLQLACEKMDFSLSCLSAESGSIHVYRDARNIDDLSIAKHGDQNHEPLYMLVEPEVEPATRKVEQRSGGVKVFFDQSSHPVSVSLRAGGVMDSLNCIIAGQIGTISNTDWSNELYKILFSSFKKRFTKIKSFYVGTEALEKLDQGCRLTGNCKSPADFDLKR